MEDIKMFCDECGILLNPSDEIHSEHTGIVHLECHLSKTENAWWMSVDYLDLINILNQADYRRQTSFYVSFIGGKWCKYFVSSRPYHAVFTVLSSREEILNAIQVKKP